ncbi:DNA-binding protein%2C HTH regulator [Mycobacterium tuberculosis]|nr:DNA-binding protein%2C HTH regulator [Mycobacterium tuberculosis]
MDKHALAAFLRARRERIRPEDVGLPRGPRRRTPGLRREEVAQLAHVSVDHYSRLEQARGRNPSRQVLDGIARALRLSGQERAHLFELAGERERDRVDGPSRLVAPGTLSLLDRLPDAPALVVDDTCRVLAWNPLAAALFGDFARMGPDRNLLRRHFLEPEGRVVDDSEFVVTSVSYLRVALARYPRNGEIRALVDELVEGSAEFARLWESQELRIEHHARERFAHPQVGEVELDFDILTVPGQDQQLIIFTAEPGTRAQETLRLLKVVGTQTMDVPA